MRSYEERAKDFIQEIFPYFTQMNKYAVRRSVCQFNEEHHRKVIVSNGLTRIALITSDYVIKFDYNEEQVENFGGCEDELYFYAKAEREGFGYLFAKITKFTYEGQNFYIMPRIHGIGKTNDDAWWHMEQTEEDWCTDNGLYDLHCHNYGWRDGHVCIFDYGAQSV